MTIARRYLVPPMLAVALTLVACANTTTAAVPVGESVAPSAPASSSAPTRTPQPSAQPESDLARISVSATGADLWSAQGELLYRQEWTSYPDEMIAVLTRALGEPSIEPFEAATMHTPDGVGFGWKSDDGLDFSVDRFDWGGDENPLRERTKVFATAGEVGGVVIESTEGVRAGDPLVWADADPYWREDFAGTQYVLVSVDPMADDDPSKAHCLRMCGDGVRLRIEDDRVAALSAPGHGFGPIG